MKTVTNQKVKINDSDRVLEDLKKAWREEQAFGQFLTQEMIRSGKKYR